MYNAKNGNGAEPKYSDARPTDICIVPSSEFAVGVKSTHAETVTLDARQLSTVLAAPGAQPNALGGD